MYHPTVLINLQCLCLHVYTDQLKPGMGISFCMILALVFCFVFFCYVSDEVVKFGIAYYRSSVPKSYSNR